jgi:hypothetical protein
MGKNHRPNISRNGGLAPCIVGYGNRAGGMHIFTKENDTSVTFAERLLIELLEEC